MEENVYTAVIFLLCFACIAKKESLGDCQQSEFPAQLSKRQRTTSRSNSDENPANADDLQIVNIDALPNTGKTCAVASSLADLCEVIHLLET